MAAIQNIKIQHKRYSSAQWQNGITLNGETIIPKLAHGEIGLATDTLEVKIGTLAAGEQTFAQARPIDSDVLLAKTYKGQAITDTTGKMVIDASFERESASGKHKLTLIYGDVPATTVEAGTATTAPTTDKVVVVSGLQNTDHAITYTTTEAATVAYVDKEIDAVEKAIDDLGDIVDTKLDSLSSTDDDIIELTTAKSGTTGTIDAKHKKYNGSNTTQTAESVALGDTVTIPVKSVSYDAYGHVTGSTSQDVTIDLSVAGGTVGEHTAASTSVTTKVALAADGTLTGNKKEIVSADGSQVSVTGTADKITIGVDLSKYATKEELSASVNGATHYAGVIEAMSITAGGKDTLDLAGYSAVEDTSNGAMYMIQASHGKFKIKDSRYPIHDHRTNEWGMQTAGNVVTVESGDMLLLHVSKNDTHWDLIPAADDIEYRGVKVNGTELFSAAEAGSVNFTAGNDGVTVGSNSGDTVVISHKTGVAEDLTKTSRTYVDSLTFDDYGHVTGYTVGTETVVDTNTAHTHTAGAKLEITGNGGIDGSVEYAHSTIQTTTNKDASKKATVTAGTGASFTVIDSLEADGYGHITNVVTKDVQIDVPEDTNTLYDIKGESITDGAQVTLTPSDALDSASNVQFTGEDGTTVSFKNGKIVISSHDTTYELATEALAGLVKVANVLSESASVNASTLKNYTGNNPDKLYGVNRKADGTMFVEVPWKNDNTTYTASNGIKIAEGTTDIQHTVCGDANKSVDLYAFGTDAYGHVSGTVAVTTIDGNYA